MIIISTLTSAVLLSPLTVSQEHLGLHLCPQGIISSAHATAAVCLDSYGNLLSGHLAPALCTGVELNFERGLSCLQQGYERVTLAQVVLFCSSTDGYQRVVFISGALPHLANPTLLPFPTDRNSPGDKLLS